LESAARTFFFTAVCGVRFIGESNDGLSRFSVGGITPSRIARAQKIASTEPAAPSRWPMADLVDDRCAVDAALPRTRATARTSISSPAGVEVPCALT
jgi:hypothetical protein